MTVIFDPDTFRALYPEFAGADYSNAILNNAFMNACMLCNNGDKSVIPYNPGNGVYDRQVLLNLLTCHILTVNAQGTVGVLTTASQGSVSSGFWMPNKNNAAWFMQTPWGYEYWQLSLKYRTGGMFIKGSPRH